MAVIDCQLGPEFLGISTTIKIILPTRHSNGSRDYSGLYSTQKKYPVVWMLHGGSGCSADLLYHLGLVSLAEQFQVAFVVPDGQSSCFRDMVYGPKWMTYITEKLPPYLYSNYPVSQNREDNLITGLSMGGYGCLQLALLKPERYGAAAPMAIGNGIVRKYAAHELDEDFDKKMLAVFGEDREKLLKSDADCYYLMPRAGKTAREVRYLLCAGTADFTHEDTETMYHAMQKEGYQADFIENKYAHEDASWSEFLPRILEWFLNKEKQSER